MGRTLKLDPDPLVEKGIFHCISSRSELDPRTSLGIGRTIDLYFYPYFVIHLLVTNIDIHCQV
jgi:hypothetical protein